MRDVLGDIAKWYHEGETFGLATVVNTFRSAPRPAGAAMAVSGGGEVVGSVSGGCVEGAVYELAQEVVESGRPVVHVRHISRSPGSIFWPGQSGAEFQPRFAPLAHEHVVEKNVPDAFAATGLERWLRVRDIDQVVIVGVITNNSVEATARSAGNLGFSATVVSDAAFTFDLRDLNGRVWPAEDVHALSLANIAMDYASVRATEAVVRMLGLEKREAPQHGGARV